MSNEKELEIFAKNWIGFYRYKACLTAIYKHQPIGFATLFLMPYKKVAHLAMIQIIVDEQFQRRGVGASLLKNIEYQAKNHFKLDSIHLEVMKDSPIEKLLNKTHYKVLFEQEDFYYVKNTFRSRVIYEKGLEGIKV